MMTLPIDSSFVEAPTMATAFGLKRASSILFPLRDLFDERFDVRFRLFVGYATEVVEVAGDDQGGYAGFGLDPLGQAVPAVRVVGARLRVVVDDPVDPELLQHLPDVLLLVPVGTDDEQLEVRLRHAADRVPPVEGREDPAAAVGGGQDGRLQVREQLGMLPQASPHGHPFPVDAYGLPVDGPHPVPDPLRKLGEKELVVVDRLPGSPEDDGRPHVDRSVAKGERGGFSSVVPARWRRSGTSRCPGSSRWRSPSGSGRSTCAWRRAWPNGSPGSGRRTPWPRAAPPGRRWCTTRPSACRLPPHRSARKSSPPFS